MHQITVLISGSGTNLQALIEASQTGKIPAQITKVISNRSKAYGLTRARAAGITDVVVLALKPFKDKAGPGREAEARAAYDKALAMEILSSKPLPQLIVCAGWMHILSANFLNDLSRIPIINLHPALPSAFDGANAIERAHEAFARGEITETGVMVHRVIAVVDGGEPLVVRHIDLRKDESLPELECRIHAVEHEAIVEGAIKALH